MSKFESTTQFSADSNPFNDPNLEKVFVWKKKAQKLGWTKEEAKKQTLLIRESNLVEIEQAKRRRIEREEEQMERLREREQAQRNRDSESHADWESREELFMMSQKKQAAALRINQGRENALDSIARNVLLMKQVQFGPEIGPDGKPICWMSNEVGMNPVSPLDQVGVDKLDLQLYAKWEKVDFFRAFWDALLVCYAEDETTATAGKRIPQIVRQSIREYCLHKTVEEIQKEKLEARAKRTNAGNEDDKLFLTELEQQLWIEECRSLVKSSHEEMLRFLTQHQRHQHRVPQVHHHLHQLQHQRRLKEQEDDEDDDLGDQNVESLFSECCFVGAETAECYIKPKFWNRVKSGYDWNKYNRAHFDSDNKPPRSIFGYKFNVVYPGGGMKRTPTYRVDRNEEEGFSTLVFLASPPFLDVGFKIESKDWDRGAHSGFKNTFENGVLQLHFNFVRRRYRR